MSDQDIVEIKADVAVLKSEVSNLKEGQNRIEGFLTNHLWHKIIEIKESQASVAAHVAAHGTRLDKLENKVEVKQMGTMEKLAENKGKAALIGAGITLMSGAALMGNTLGVIAGGVMILAGLIYYLIERKTGDTGGDI